MLIILAGEKRTRVTSKKVLFWKKFVQKCRKSAKTAENQPKFRLFLGCPWAIWKTLKKQNNKNKP